MDCDLQTRGRPRKHKAPQTEGKDYLEQFSADLNGVQVTDTRVLYSGAERWLFRCPCCAHYKYMTCEGFQRAVDEKGKVVCLICTPPVHMSEIERSVMSVLLQSFPERLVIPHCKPLLKFPGEVDFCLPKDRVIIQVDGPMHFEESGYPEGTLERQQEADEECINKCLAQGWYLLRLHHNDVELHTKLWVDKILVRATLSLENKAKGRRYAQSCVVYSKTWGRDHEYRFSDA